MGVKPVTTPVSVYVNLLFCRFIRQGKKTGVPRGCKCDWHRSQLARSSAERRWRQSEGRDEKLGFRCIRCRHVTAQSDRAPKFQISLEAREGSRSPFSYLCSSLLHEDKWTTENTPSSPDLAHACLPHAALPPHTSPQAARSSLPPSTLHHLVVSRSARLLTTCAIAGPALAPGLIVHW